jgi:hypothetical protein
MFLVDLVKFMRVTLTVVFVLVYVQTILFVHIMAKEALALLVDTVIRLLDFVIATQRVQIYQHNIQMKVVVIVLATPLVDTVTNRTNLVFAIRVITTQTAPLIVLRTANAIII